MKISSILHYCIGEKIENARLQEGSEATQFMDMKAAAKQKKIKMSPSR